MKNEGKRFEDDIKKSAPEYALLYKLPDPSQSFGGSSTLRFSRKNPFDFLIWDSINKNLFAIETKTVKGKSISFERSKDEHGVIHIHQINSLKEWDKYNGVICGFIIEFRQIEITIFIDIKTFCKLSNLITKKSFTIDDLDNNNLKYIVIPQVKKRIRYIYDLDYFLRMISEEVK